MDKSNITIGILTGGKSCRMGCDKAMLPLGNTTFLDHILKEFSTFEEVLVSTSRAYNVEDKCKLIYDTIRDYGPLEGVRQLLIHSTNQWVFVTATDTPLVNCSIVECLAKEIKSE
ncbi:MAG: molybdenum cofactor guanylyltransferase, partial [Sphaerochaetaceae bacterium]|nr:molybdenum cofactor guanylyltransferase [Sphaerochaetaceae bacterium]